MASSPFSLVHQGPVTVAYIRGEHEPCAHIYRQSDKSGYRFRLVNYPHRMSALFTDMKALLKRLEQEVL